VWSDNQGIVWQGVEYLPIPVETDGFEVNANGQLSRPKMRISNKDYFATDLLLNNDDLQFAKVIRKRTFVKYLDDVNFDGGNPWGESDASAELSNDTFVVGQKTAENKVFIELELTSPLDLENFEVNNRLIMSRYCSWHYRGNGCNYNGIPLATEEGESLIVGDPIDWFTNQALKEWSAQRYYSSGDAAYLENKKITIANPSNSSQSEFAKIWYVCQANHSGSSLTIPDKNQSLWKRDGCNKKLDGCQLRFGKGSLEFGEKTVQRTANFVDFTSQGDFGMPGQTRYFVKTVDDLVKASEKTSKPLIKERKPKGYVGW
jgi:lambda family phage minor tail protein L